MNINTSDTPIPEPNPPPELNDTDDFTPSPLTSSSSLTLLQLNVHRSESVLHNVLHTQSYHMILVQEPWISPFTLSAVVHPSWHLIMPMGHKPQTIEDRAKTCIYLSKTIPTKSFTYLPTDSPLLTALDLDDSEASLRLRVLSWYNPPTDFCGLPVLQQWMSHHNRRNVPTLLSMDSNLHHRAWNPPYRRRHAPSSSRTHANMWLTKLQAHLSEGGTNLLPPKGRW